MKIIILALCFAGVLAQVPTRCVSPLAWEGILVEIDPSKTFERFAKLSYDASNERMVIREELREHEGRQFYEEIFLHRENIGYRINMKTRECERFTLREPFRRIEVPSSANFTSTGYIGSSVSGAGVLVDVFSAQTERGRYVGAWTQKGCVPVNDAYYSLRTGFVHWSFYDVTLGISDPNIFIPPVQCRS